MKYISHVCNKGDKVSLWLIDCLIHCNDSLQYDFYAYSLCLSAAWRTDSISISQRLTLYHCCYISVIHILSAVQINLL